MLWGCADTEQICETNIRCDTERHYEIEFGSRKDGRGVKGKCPWDEGRLTDGRQSI